MSESCSCCCCRSCATTQPKMTTPTSRQRSSSSSGQNMIRTRRWYHNSARWLLLVGACSLFLAKVQSSRIIVQDEPPSSEGLNINSGRLLVKQHAINGDRLWDQKSHHDHNKHHHHQSPDRRHRQLENSPLQDYLGSRGKRISAREQGRKHHQRKEHFYQFINMPTTTTTISENPQVPEQLPIVVSSSDNSYVSASPVVFGTAPKATTAAPLAHDDDGRPIVSHLQRPPFSASQQQSSPSHSRRLLTSSIEHKNPDNFDADDDDDDDDDDGLNETERRKHTEPLVWFSLGASVGGPSGSGRTSSSSIDGSSSGSSSSSGGSNHLLDKIGSTSDISTTATTTQRNNHDGNLLLRQVKKRPTRGEKHQSLVSKYEIKLATIINTQESIDAGASFINYTVVTNFNACLVECWITDSCDTAVYQESKIASSTSYSEQQHKHHDRLHSKRRQASQSADIDNSPYHTCFLFECVKSAEFRCQFSAHDNYVSSILMNKVVGDATAREETDPQHSEAIGEQFISDKSSINKYVGAPMTGLEGRDRDASRDCDQELEFRCLPGLSKGVCIEIGRRCDGVADCSDGSDEFYCSSDSDFATNQPGPFVSAEQPNDVVVDDVDSSSKLASYSLIVDQDQTAGGHSLELSVGPTIAEVPHYSKIIQAHHSHRGHWHDTHVASIRIGGYEDYDKGGLNSALIAILFGVAITAMLIMIVGHKMRSIRTRLAYKSRQRNLVPDKELLINTMPI